MMGNRDGRKMSVEDFGKILELGTVDSGSEGLFCVQSKKDVKAHVMTLVIGIGESGNTALLKAREIADRKLYEGYSGHLRFLALGSGQEELAPLESRGIDTLSLSLPDVQKRLQDKITGYCAGDPQVAEHGQVDIMILTGLSEETERGAFINTAVWAKHACPAPGNVIVYGFLILPDSANELVAFDEVLCSAKEPPYDRPFIMSGNFDETVGAVAEMIVYFASVSGVSFYPQGFFANKSQIIGLKIAEMMSPGEKKSSSDKSQEALLAYCSGGYAHASIPEKIVIPHVVGEVCRNLYIPSPDMGAVEPGAAPMAFCDRERPLNRQEYETAMRRLLGLTPHWELKESSLWNRITRQWARLLLPIEDSVEININKATALMERVVKEELETIKKNAEKVMKSFGPRAMHFLYYGYGGYNEHGAREDYSSICLKAQIDYVVYRFVSMRPGIMPKRPEPTSFLEKAIEQFNHKRLDAWKAEVSKYKEMNIRYGVAQNMCGDDGIWKTCFVNPLMDFLWDTERFADVLETMSEYYEAVGASLKSNDFREFANQGGDANGINICRDAATYSWVKEKIRSKLENIRIQDVRDGLIDDFYMNTSAWTSDEAGTARKQFDECMGKECVLGKYALLSREVDISIYDYFDHLTSNVPREQQQIEIDKAVRYIVEELLDKSKPRIKVSEDITLMSYGAIILPLSLRAMGESRMIEEAFNRAIEKSDAKDVRLEFSEHVDSIVCYQVSAGNSIWELAEFDLW